MATGTGKTADADDCAREMIEVVPLAARWIRASVRRSEPSWSIPQLMALGFIHFKPDASLSELAAHLGVGLPTASTLVSRLVVLGQVDRRDDPAERRRALLRLTPRGEAQLTAALAASQEELAELLRALPARDLTRLTQALEILRRLFSDR
ncbi:MAG: MarR family winged helix-turn-helix transcriptional regulator [Actinomycetota bacterium]|jgi:DNA-binding MarR family transcriptional regulator